MAKQKQTPMKTTPITAIPIINKVQAEVKHEDFIEVFAGVFVTLNDKVKEDVKKLVTAKKLTSDEVENYIQSGKPLYSDIYKFLVADGTLKNYRTSQFCSI